MFCLGQSNGHESERCARWLCLQQNVSDWTIQLHAGVIIFSASVERRPIMKYHGRFTLILRYFLLWLSFISEGNTELKIFYMCFIADGDSSVNCECTETSVIMIQQWNILHRQVPFRWIQNTLGAICRQKHTFTLVWFANQDFYF